MTIRAGGIKVSPPLAQLDLARGAAAESGLAELLHGLAAEQINVTFLTRSGPGAPTAASLCVAESDLTRATEVAQRLAGLASRLSVVAPVVALSVFPHRASAGLLGTILRALDHRKLPLLGLATSLAALTFTLNASHLARTLAVLDEILELPANHAPLRWELLVKPKPA